MRKSRIFISGEYQPLSKHRLGVVTSSSCAGETFCFGDPISVSLSARLLWHGCSRSLQKVKNHARNIRVSLSLIELRHTLSAPAGAHLTNRISSCAPGLAFSILKNVGLGPEKVFALAR